MTYGVPYVVAGLVFAFVSFRRSAVVVGVLWLLHGLYDLVHGQVITNIGVPGWYPIFCFVVDAVIGAYLQGYWAGEPGGQRAITSLPAGRDPTRPSTS